MKDSSEQFSQKVVFVKSPHYNATASNVQDAKDVKDTLAHTFSAAEQDEEQPQSSDTDMAIRMHKLITPNSAIHLPRQKYMYLSERVSMHMTNQTEMNAAEWHHYMTHICVYMYYSARRRVQGLSIDD